MHPWKMLRWFISYQQNAVRQMQPSPPPQCLLLQCKPCHLLEKTDARMVGSRKKSIPVNGTCPLLVQKQGTEGGTPKPFRSQQRGGMTFLQRAGLIAGSSFLPFPLVSTQRGGELYVRARMLSVGEFWFRPCKNTIDLFLNMRFDVQKAILLFNSTLLP